MHVRGESDTSDVHSHAAYLEVQQRAGVWWETFDFVTAYIKDLQRRHDGKL